MSSARIDERSEQIHIALYAKRESYQFWYRAMGVALTITIVAFVIFNTLSLINNPNYEIWASAVTASQRAFVIGSIVNIVVFGSIGMILRVLYEACDYAINKHEVRFMNR